MIIMLPELDPVLKRWTEWLQIRSATAAADSPGLIVHPKDRDEDPIVGERGWIIGWEGKRPKYRQAPRAECACYCVPDQKLRPISELAPILGLMANQRLVLGNFSEVDLAPGSSEERLGLSVANAHWTLPQSIVPEKFVAMWKLAGAEINPQSAIMAWAFRSVLDPYDIYGLPEKWTQVGRQYFARARESDVWVSFYDLPRETRDRLWQKYCGDVASGAADVGPINGRSQAQTTQIIHGSSNRAS
ncbi:hypothetical protein [Bradyrhizobium sp. F1.13.3]|uniref:hypothetical protein n=1 Tax=Bradyrhizobium sp. F1.13.3 TaxID=3156351 RepID=UPI00339B3C56